MSVRERILTVRLIEKLRACPGYTGVLGIEVIDRWPSERTDQKMEG